MSASDNAYATLHVDETDLLVAIKTTVKAVETLASIQEAAQAFLDRQSEWLNAGRGGNGGDGGNASKSSGGKGSDSDEDLRFAAMVNARNRLIDAALVTIRRAVKHDARLVPPIGGLRSMDIGDLRPVFRLINERFTNEYYAGEALAPVLVRKLKELLEFRARTQPQAADALNAAWRRVLQASNALNNAVWSNDVVGTEFNEGALRAELDEASKALLALGVKL